MICAARLAELANESVTSENGVASSADNSLNTSTSDDAAKITGWPSDWLPALQPAKTTPARRTHAKGRTRATYLVAICWL